MRVGSLLVGEERREGKHVGELVGKGLQVRSLLVGTGPGDEDGLEEGLFDLVCDDEVGVVEDVGRDAVEAVAHDRRERRDRLLEVPVHARCVVAVLDYGSRELWLRRRQSNLRSHIAGVFWQEE
jgi:hypothetical protein